MDKSKLIDNAQRAIARRQASLKDTLDEIELLEALQAQGHLCAAAIVAAKVKRDRQHQNLEAAIQLHAALNTKKAK